MSGATPDAHAVLDAEAAAAAETSHAGGLVERREKRVAANLVGAIRLPDGVEIPCIVKDVSPSGAKLGVPASCALPERFMFKVNNRPLVFRVRLAWRRQHFAGVEIEQIAKLPPGHRRG